MSGDQLSILGLMDADPSHASGRAAVIAAVLTTARLHDEFTRDTIRPHIPAWVYPNTIGATISGLVGAKILVWTRRFDITEDDGSGNGGKGAKVYRCPDLPSLRRLVEETG